jgi:hypothetical protein
MALVIWRVEIHAIPARGEADRGTDATLAELVGKAGRVVGSDAWRCLIVCKRVFYETSVADAARFPSCAAKHRVAG